MIDNATIGFIIGAAAMWLPFLFFTVPDVYEIVYDIGIAAVFVLSLLAWLFVGLIFGLWKVLL